MEEKIKPYEFIVLPGDIIEDTSSYDILIYVTNVLDYNTALPDVISVELDVELSKIAEVIKKGPYLRYYSLNFHYFRRSGKSPDEILKLLKENATKPLPTFLGSDLKMWKAISEGKDSIEEEIERAETRRKIKRLKESRKPPEGLPL
jgi:hypothetical protein